MGVPYDTIHDGCFKHGTSLGNVKFAASTNSSANSYEIGLDASLSNSIYGSSTTVTPLSESCIFCISY